MLERIRANSKPNCCLNGARLESNINAHTCRKSAVKGLQLSAKLLEALWERQESLLWLLRAAICAGTLPTQTNNGNGKDQNCYGEVRFKFAKTESEIWQKRAKVAQSCYHSSWARRKIWLSPRTVMPVLQRVHSPWKAPPQHMPFRRFGEWFTPGASDARNCRDSNLSEQVFHCARVCPQHCFAYA